MARVPDPVLGLDTSNAPKFDERKQFWRCPDFRIGGRYDYGDPKSFERGAPGGVTLESLGLPPVQLGYVALGTPHRNKKGEIDNALLICPYYSGDATGLLDFWAEDGTRLAFSEGACIGPGRLFDTDRYYVVLADALGLWGASKPSASHPGHEDSKPLGLRFPQYRLEDCVQLMYRLLRDHLKVARLELVTGVSLGAALSYVWSALHPEYVKASLPIGGTTFQDKGMARWLFDLMTAAIQSDPVYRLTNGEYYHLPRLQRPIMGNLFGWSIIRQSGFVDEYRCKQTPEQFQAESFDWERAKEVVDSLGKRGWGAGLFAISLIDSNDLIFRNRAQALHNMEDELHRVTARTLIVHVETDQWLYPHLAQRAHERIKGSSLITFRHDLGHYGVFAAPNRYRAEMEAFLKD